ncbi:MAG: metallophosphoesterase [Promethearchaeota archaeon]
MKTILHRPIYLFVLLILAILSAIVFLIHLIIDLVLIYTGNEINQSILLCIDIFLTFFLFFLAMRFLYRRFVDVVPSASFAHNFDEGPWLHWREDPKTTITINWFSKKESGSCVLFGEDENHLRMIKDGYFGKMHHVTVRGLTPGRTYCYSVPGFSKNGIFYKFQTAPDGSKPFNFVVIGDTQNGGGNGNENWGYYLISKALQSIDFDLLMHVGDVSDQGNDLKSWHQFFSNSPYIAWCPIHIAVGNHDTGTVYLSDKSAKKYPDEGANFDFFFNYTYQVPATENEITPFKGRYYSFIYSNCLFIFLDTQNSKMAEPKNSQWEFLRRVLKNAPKRYWKVAFIHRPMIFLEKGKDGLVRYGYSRFADYILPIFLEERVDIVFQGHGHYYHHLIWPVEMNHRYSMALKHELDWKINFFTCGGAGNDYRRNPPILSQDLDLPGFIIQEDSTHYLLVSIKQSSCIIEARYPDNSKLDKYVVRKGDELVEE